MTSVRSISDGTGSVARVLGKEFHQPGQGPARGGTAAHIRDSRCRDRGPRRARVAHARPGRWRARRWGPETRRPGPGARTPRTSGSASSPKHRAAGQASSRPAAGPAAGRAGRDGRRPITPRPEPPCTSRRVTRRRQLPSLPSPWAAARPARPSTDVTTRKADGVRTAAYASVELLASAGTTSPGAGTTASARTRSEPVTAERGHLRRLDGPVTMITTRCPWRATGRRAGPVQPPTANSPRPALNCT